MQHMVKRVSCEIDGSADGGAKHVDFHTGKEPRHALRPVNAEKRRSRILVRVLKVLCLSGRQLDLPLQPRFYKLKLDQKSERRNIKRKRSQTGLHTNAPVTPDTNPAMRRAETGAGPLAGSCCRSTIG